MAFHSRHAARTQEWPALAAGRAPLLSRMAPAAERHAVRRRASRQTVEKTMAVCLAFLFSSCTSGGPREVPKEVQVSIFEYQIEHQVPKETQKVAIAAIDPPLHRSISKAVVSAIRTEKTIVTTWDEGSLPDAFLSVETQAERVYPDSLVVLGLVDVRAPESSKAFRYRFDRIGERWNIVWSKEVEVDTDCYGNVWVESGAK